MARAVKHCLRRGTQAADDNDVKAYPLRLTAQLTPGFASTYNPVSFSTDTRTWNDLNRDDIAQENELGPTSNLAFGMRRNQNPSEDIKRPYQWVADIGVQHELRRGLAVSIRYNERSFHDIWTDNLAIAQ